MLRPLAILSLALWLVCAPALPQSQTNTDTPAHGSIEALHEAFLTDQDLQLAFPEPEPEEDEQAEPPGWLRWLIDALGSVFQTLGPLLRLAFYLIVGAGVVAILAFILRGALESRFAWLKRDRGPGVEDSVAPDFRPDAQAARSLLDEADALAARGRFAEAVHLLLFRSIEDIQRQHEGGVPVSLTAREIASLDALPDRARNRLSPIIQIVERSFFGGRTVDGEGWRSARTSYEEFAFGEAVA
ncbi:MAG: hypothetical protein AAFR00_10145 [Pseudomonadota bacterium]